ncbi:unnamed protein product [Heterobilharzia americana]|nr:unnamed protein product [Heterobilharzia americana]
MNFFPAPFSLGTSDMLVTDILPVNVEECPQDVEKSIVSCQVGNVLYTSKLKSTLRDSNYATVIYNKKKKTVEVIHKKPEFLEPCFDDDVIEVPNALKADRAALINAFGSVKKQRAMREIERNKTHKDSMTNAQVIDRAMHGQARLKAKLKLTGSVLKKIWKVQIRSRDLMRKVPLPDTPSSVMKLLLSQFTALVNRQGMGRQKVRVISPMLRDKLITHMLILVLHCDSFKTVVDKLAVDFKIGRDRLAQYFQHLGCKCSKVENIENKSEINIYAELVTPVKLLTLKSHK